MMLVNRDNVLDAVKGFLILLIVLEHNTLLTAEYYWIRPFCDAVAVGCFLVLTFRNKPQLTNVLTYLDKKMVFYWTFFLFVSALAVMNYLMFSHLGFETALKNYFAAILWASPQAIKASSGFMYLWFIPCLCLLYLLQRLTASFHKSMLVLAFICWLIIGIVDRNILVQMPFSLHVIAFIYFVGLVYQQVNAYLMQNTLVMKALTISIFLICSVLSYFIGWKLFLAAGIMPSFQEPHLLLYYTVFIIFAIPGSYNLISLMPSALVKILALFGKYSLIVYVLHPLIYVILTEIFSVIENPALSFFATIVLSIFCALLLARIPVLMRLLFPASFSQLLKFKGRKWLT